MDENQKEQIQNHLAMFKSITESMESLLAENEKLLAENENLRETASFHKREKESLERQLTKRNSEIAGLRKELQEANQMNDLCQEKLKTLHMEVKSFEKKLKKGQPIEQPPVKSESVLEAENKRLLKQVQDMTLENETLKAQLKLSEK
ncbi:MAG: hypothetical protein E7496_06910 [Ruminococcus sp.]|nr:hypothetical protein [Ruminococcus sp.]